MQRTKFHKKWQLFILMATILFTLNYSAPSRAEQSFEEIFGEFTGDFAGPPEKKYQSALPDKLVTPLTSDLLVSQNALERMSLAIASLEKIVRAGGWPVISSKGARISAGTKRGELIKVKQSLVLQGDLNKRDVNFPNEFDYKLEEALTRFQKRHGLKASGIIDRRTRLALSFSAGDRLKQLQLNKYRLSLAVGKLQRNKNVIVNIPDYSLQAVEGENVVLASRVIVGRNDRQTPVISAKIEGVNFNPYWHVPKSIVVKDLIPFQRKKANFLQSQKIKVFKSWGGRELAPSSVNWYSPEVTNYKFRQDPGDHNALGLIRIHMPNKDIVYLHDTPTKKLYARRGRAFSSGCVRVQKIQKLAQWILSGKESWGEVKVKQTLQSGKRIDAMINKPISVQFLYITAWVDSRKELHFRDDIYKRDRLRGYHISRLQKVTDSERLSP